MAAAAAAAVAAVAAVPWVSLGNYYFYVVPVGSVVSVDHYYYLVVVYSAQVSQLTVPCALLEAHISVYSLTVLLHLGSPRVSQLPQMPPPHPHSPHQYAHCAAADSQFPLLFLQLLLQRPYNKKSHLFF